MPKKTTVYVIKRDCCLGPNCSRGHSNFQRFRVTQLRTTKLELANKCFASYNAAGYFAEMEELKTDDPETAMKTSSYEEPVLVDLRERF